jgi:hypothetical protein
MLSRDYIDVITGLVLATLGLGAAIFCAVNYDVGRLNFMGPGMFPAGAGVCLAVFGVLIAAPAWLRAGPKPDINIRATAAVIVSVCIFAATLISIGLVPATILCVAIAGLGDPRIGVVESLILGVVLAGLAWFIFIFALALSLPAFHWPL